ncbi:MAG TPA: PilN domain-containing protein [Anaeromyxobacteraceae bacterium]|nr:PilN domain-containing protein [Anaeromyxobacteraceae bacterium]
MIRINLLPVRVSKKKEAGKNQLIFFALAVVFAVVCNSLWTKSRADEVAAREDKLKRTRAEIAQLEKIIGEVKNIKDEQAAVRDKLAVLDKLKAGRQGPVRVLDDLAGIIPKRLWLKKFEEKGGAVSFEGVAASIDDVSAFLAGLKKSRYFSAPELRKTNAKLEGKVRMVEFTMTAGVNYTPSVQIALGTAGEAKR